MKNRIKKIIFGSPLRGEPINYNRGQKTHTVMPDNSIHLLQWMRGKWSDYLNNKNFGRQSCS